MLSEIRMALKVVRPLTNKFGTAQIIGASVGAGLASVAYSRYAKTARFKRIEKKVDSLASATRPTAKGVKRPMAKISDIIDQSLADIEEQTSQVEEASEGDVGEIAKLFDKIAATSDKTAEVLFKVNEALGDGKGTVDESTEVDEETGEPTDEVEEEPEEQEQEEPEEEEQPRRRRSGSRKTSTRKRRTTSKS